MAERISTLTVDIPYKSSGGVIHQRPVNFDVYKAEDHYSLKPCLGSLDLQLANLPEELRFVMENGKPVSLRGKMDGNLHVIQDAVALLQQQQHHLI